MPNVIAYRAPLEIRKNETVTMNQYFTSLLRNTNITEQYFIFQLR